MATFTRWLSLTMPGAAAEPRTVRVAYWRDPVKVRKEKRKGMKPKSVSVPARIESAPAEAPMKLHHLSTQDLLDGKLTTASYDVLCVPGGYAPNYLEELGGESWDEPGVRAVVDFVQSGGGYVGICAGAYVGTTWGINLLDVDIVDLEHWARGMSQRCWLAYTQHGKEVLGAGAIDEVVVRYANGPLLRINSTDVDVSEGKEPSGGSSVLRQDSDSPRRPFVVASFMSDFARRKSQPVGVMCGSPAIVAGWCGRGRVVLVSPHPEDGEPATRPHFRNLFRWAASVPAAELLPESAAQLEAQAAARGEWWRTLPRLPRLKYPPHLKDHGVKDSVQRLSSAAKLARAASRRDSSTASAARSTTQRAHGHRANADGAGLAGAQSRGRALSRPADRGGRRRASSCAATPSSRPQRSFRAGGSGGAGAGAGAGAGVGGQAGVGKPRANGHRGKHKPAAAPHDGYSMMDGKLPLPYVECINGPILLTAPHGLRLCAPRRKHFREKYTSELVLKIAKEVRKHLGVEASFMVWNYKTARKSDKRNLDPNYLLESEWSKSPWHATLLKFRAKFKEQGVPCLHVDFHGKKDRPRAKKCRVDIGMQPFEEHHEAVGWEEGDVDALRDRFEQHLDAALEGVTIRGKKCEANPDPVLHGWWGDDCETTMTHQAVLAGIPSLQLENPRSLRRKMMTDDELVRRYTAAIVEAYRTAAKIEASHGVVSGTADTSGSLGELAPIVEAPPPPTDDEALAHPPKWFFVYGSLRPDDPTNQSWRDAWLAGSVEQLPATVHGQLFKDTYACAVLGDTATHRIHGYVVRFPAGARHASKLRDADEIEACPSLYQRAAVIATTTSGRRMLAWVYHRSACSKDNPVPGGDWVKFVKPGKQHGAAGLAGSLLQKFVSDGLPVYRGQDGGASFGGCVSSMIDTMLADIAVLDSRESGKQT